MMIHVNKPNMRLILTAILNIKKNKWLNNIKLMIGFIVNQ